MVYPVNAPITNADVPLVHQPITLASAVIAAPTDRPMPQIAIINDAETGAFADQILAVLSKRSDVILLERNQIGQVLREQHANLAGMRLQDSLQLGHLMKADGLLIITARSAEKIIVARLVAVNPGVIIWSWQFTPAMPDMTKAISVIEQRMGGLLPKLMVPRDTATPFSVLNLRCVVATSHAASLEQELTELLIDRLAHEPSIFVMERQQMASLQWEKEFVSVTTNSFWTSRYVIDGTIPQEGTNVVVQARLRPPTSQWAAPVSISE